MAKVWIVTSHGLGDVLHPILGVFSEECEAQARNLAQNWMNESAGNNVYHGHSIGSRKDFGAYASVEDHIVKELSKT